MNSWDLTFALTTNCKCIAVKTVLNRKENKDIYFDLFTYNYNQAIFHQMKNISLRILKLSVFLKPETENSNVKIYIQMQIMDF